MSYRALLTIVLITGYGASVDPTTLSAQSACGAEGQRACCLLERGSTCDGGLAEIVRPNSGRCGGWNPFNTQSNGVCARITPCGDEGQRACCAGERGYACVDGLVELPVANSGQCGNLPGGIESSGVCARVTPCGGQGKRACCVGERSATCDVGLVERPASNFGQCGRLPPGIQSSGVCVPVTPCGDVGQRACTLAEGGSACLSGLTELPGCTGDCQGSSGVCADMRAALSEPDANSSPLPAADPMRGFADIHVHMFSQLAFGGAVLTGKPYSTAGVADALKSDYGSELDLVDLFGADLPPVSCPPSVPNCGSVLLHGDHVPLVDDLVGTATGDGTRTHFGAPSFNGWPTFRSTTHQQVYYKWLERAWRGGMRLMVMLAVNNEALCRLSKHIRGTDCGDSMRAIDQQLSAAREFQAWLDAQPGGGWFEIVLSSSEAERAIREGKLAVVLGIEVDSLFNCKVGVPCTRDYLREQIAHYRDMGVRHIFPTHDFDNGMAGTAVWMDFLNLGNRVIEGAWYDVEPCTRSDFVLSSDPIPAGLGVIVNSVLNVLDPTNNVPYPDYPSTSVCNQRGLSDNGVALIDELMKAGMMIDIDHMSARSVAETLSIAGERDYPVSVGHGLFADQYQAEHARHERMRTAAELTEIHTHGGIVSVMTTAEQQPLGKDDCQLSSKSFAQNYLYAARALDGDPVAFGSDFNGLAPHVGPRFGDSACNGNATQWAAQIESAPRLQYPFTLPGFGVFERQVTGQRTFDFNVDGLAHIGMLPDLIADMLTLGVSAEELEPLMSSAKGYVDAWRHAELSSSALNEQ